jgi:hypothetical protein
LNPYAVTTLYLEGFAITQLNPSGHSTSVDLGHETRARRLLTTDMFFTSTNSNYERLEGGFGPLRTTRMLAWKKFAIGAVVLISVVWFFGPRSSLDSITGASCDSCRRGMHLHIMKQRLDIAWHG